MIEQHRCPDDPDKLIQMLVNASKARLLNVYPYHTVVWSASQADKILRRMCMAILRYVACHPMVEDDLSSLLHYYMEEVEESFDESYILRDTLNRSRLDHMFSCRLTARTQSQLKSWPKMMCRLACVGRFGSTSRHPELSGYMWRHSNTHNFNCSQKISSEHIHDILHDLVEHQFPPCDLLEGDVPSKCRSCGKTDVFWIFGDSVTRPYICDNCRTNTAHPLKPCPWVNEHVKTLLAAVYANRIGSASLLDNEALLVLADALEEAGCTTNGDELHPILQHLRKSETHYFGCWAVERLKGNYRY